jgi:hypothetical protein
MQPKLSTWSQQSRNLDSILGRAVVFPQPARLSHGNLEQSTQYTAGRALEN